MNLTGLGDIPKMAIPCNGRKEKGNLRCKVNQPYPHPLLSTGGISDQASEMSCRIVIDRNQSFKQNSKRCILTRFLLTGGPGNYWAYLHVQLVHATKFIVRLAMYPVKQASLAITLSDAVYLFTQRRIYTSQRPCRSSGLLDATPRIILAQPGSLRCMAYPYGAKQELEDYKLERLSILEILI